MYIRPKQTRCSHDHCGIVAVTRDQGESCISPSGTREPGNAHRKDEGPVLAAGNWDSNRFGRLRHKSDTYDIEEGVCLVHSPVCHTLRDMAWHTVIRILSLIDFRSCYRTIYSEVCSDHALTHVQSINYKPY